MEKLRGTWPAAAIPNVKSITVHELEEGKRLLVANEHVFAVQKDDVIVPFVGADLQMLSLFPAVTVDMGAVKFVCNGAKMMRPGITKFDSFVMGGIVLVKDQVHGKILASGKAIVDSETAAPMQKGYVVETLHYISDEMWEKYKEI